jgi:hypothetical protein
MSRPRLERVAPRCRSVTPHRGSAPLATRCFVLLCKPKQNDGCVTPKTWGKFSPTPLSRSRLVQNS